MKSFKSASVVLSLLWVVVLAGYAQAANPMVNLKPGDSQERDFILYSKIDFLKLGPAQVFLVIGVGDNASKLGDLSIAIKTSVASSEFATQIDYTLTGVALPLSATPAPISISQVSTVPNALTKVVSFNATYGFALVAVYISTFDGDTYGQPVKFSVIFTMAKQK